MKRILMAALVGVLVSGPGFAAEKTIRDILALTDTDPSKTFMEIEISGIGSGFSWANTALASRGDKLLYCQPDITITTDQYFSIFRGYAEKNPAMLDENSYIRGLVLLRGLQEAFPCPK
jgi:hypothetical protein